MESVYTTSEAARKLGVSADAVRMWEREGKLEAVKSQHGRRFFSEKALSKIAEERQRARDRRR